MHIEKGSTHVDQNQYKYFVNTTFANVINGNLKSKKRCIKWCQYVLTSSSSSVKDGFPTFLYNSTTPVNKNRMHIKRK